jgi:hypothetical protein
VNKDEGKIVLTCRIEDALVTDEDLLEKILFNRICFKERLEGIICISSYVNGFLL